MAETQLADTLSAAGQSLVVYHVNELVDWIYYAKSTTEEAK